MKNKNLLIAIASVALFSSCSFANGFQPTPYVSADVGITFPTKFTKQFYGSKPPKHDAYYSVGIGYMFDESLMFGLNLFKTSFNIQNSTLRVLDPSQTERNISVNHKIKNTGLALNVSYYLTKLESVLIPYINLDVGVVRNSPGIHEYKDIDSNHMRIRQPESTSNALLLGLGGGLGYKVTNKIMIGGGYKFLSFGNVSMKNKAQNMIPENRRASTRIVDDTNYEPIETKIKTHLFYLSIKTSF